MQHNHIIDTTSRDLEAWVARLWVSEDQKDYYQLRQTIEPLLKGSTTDSDRHVIGLEVAETLRLMDVDQITLIAALLSDSYFVERQEIDDIQREYGEAVALLCENMRTLHHFRECLETADSEEDDEKRQAEQLRRMLIAMIKDVRVLLIKLAWHLQYLRTLSRQDIANKHQCAARRTMDIYAPLANRLGISQIKWELEDLAFRFLEPSLYKNIAKSLSFKRIERENYINAFSHTVSCMLEEYDIQADVSGRPKHIYSIWKKMTRKSVGIDQLYDLRAVRIIVADIPTCYHVLGLVHERWPHIPEEWDDYVANRKPNGYQSIHTVVIGPAGRHVEIQIRTQEMHEFAELGVAAHWRYKEGNKRDQVLDKVVNSLRRVLDSSDNDSELLEDFRAEVFSDRVFVLTPKGKVINLVRGATPIDFAYAIHTDIGHRTRGAKVNGAIVPLNYELQNGEQIEILTTKQAHPKMNWLNENLGYAKSARTRQKINHWFRQQDHDNNYQEGQTILEREKHLLNLPNLSAKELAQTFKRNDARDFLVALGRGDIGHRQLTETLIRSRESEIRFRKVKKQHQGDQSGIVVRGVSDLYTQIAQCCQPVHGDDVIGYITHGRGISVHRSDCSNITHLTDEQHNRLIEVSWGGNHTDYAVDILVAGYNQPGLLRDIADLLARAKVNVLAINTRPTHDSQFALMDITIQIQDTTELANILERLTQISGVTDAQRRV